MGKPYKSESNAIARECLVTALIQLLKTKELSAITVTELAHVAGVSRMTFYRNYNSLEGILTQRLADILEEYRSDEEVLTGIYYDRQHVSHYFDYVFKYREFLDALVNCGYGTAFLAAITEYSTQRWSTVSDSTEVQYRLGAFSGALYNVFCIWSQNNYELEKSELIDMFVTQYRDLKE